MKNKLFIYLFCGQLVQQFCMFSSLFFVLLLLLLFLVFFCCCWLLLLGLVFWPRLGDPFVCQSPIGIYVCHSLGQILGCAYTFCSYGEIQISCTSPCGSLCPPICVYSYIPSMLICCIRLLYDCWFRLYHHITYICYFVVLSILALIWLVLMALFCTAYYYYDYTFCEFFSLALGEGHSRESESQQVSSGVQDSSQYSRWSQQWWGPRFVLRFPTLPFHFPSLWGTVPSVPITSHIAFTLMFPKLPSTLARSKYLLLLSFSLVFTL